MGLAVLLAFLLSLRPSLSTLSCPTQTIRYFDQISPSRNVQYSIEQLLTPYSIYSIQYSDIEPSTFPGYILVANRFLRKKLTADASNYEIQLLVGETITDSYEYLDVVHSIQFEFGGGEVFETSYTNCNLVQKGTCELHACPGQTFICTCCKFEGFHDCPRSDDSQTTTVPETSTIARNPVRTTSLIESTTERSTLTTTSIDPTGMHPNVTFPDAKIGLKNLTEIPMTHSTVHYIMNQSLVYSRLGNGLEADDLTALSILMSTASQLTQLDHDVSRVISC